MVEFWASLEKNFIRKTCSLEAETPGTGVTLQILVRGAGGGGWPRPEVQPLTLLYTILAENAPLLYTFY